MAGELPVHAIAVYGSEDPLPADIEAMLAEYLADSRRALGAGHGRSFILTAALSDEGQALGAVLLDLAPLASGPLGETPIAYLERTFVRPEYRLRGLGTRLLNRAIEAAAEAGCWYIRCSNDWDNAAERALFLRCGFVLVDNNDEDPGPEPCYQAIRPLRPGVP